MSYFPQAGALLVRAIFSGHYTFCVLLAPLLLFFGVRFNEWLKGLNIGWLEWSPFHVKSNIALVPIRLRFLWLPYALLLGFCMPMFAFMEEIIFRNGTTNLLHGLLWGTLAFGGFHLLSLVSIRMTIYLTLVGAVFVVLYLLDGILAVFVLHAVYNLTALAMTVVTRNRRPATPAAPSAGAPVAVARA